MILKNIDMIFIITNPSYLKFKITKPTPKCNPK